MFLKCELYVVLDCLLKIIFFPLYYLFSFLKDLWILTTVILYLTLFCLIFLCIFLLALYLHYSSSIVSLLVSASPIVFSSLLCWLCCGFSCPSKFQSIYQYLQNNLLGFCLVWIDYRSSREELELTVLSFPICRYGIPL